MKSIISIALTTVLCAVGATAPASAGNDWIPVRGEFTASIDFATLTLTPVGANCLLEVEGALIFTGTIEGLAPGSTRALVLADCSDVAVNPPGTFKDLFRSHLEFVGTVDGEPTMADITYRGRTAVGGDITALMVLSNGANGVLRVEAFVAVGGSYRGFVILEDFDDSD